MKNKSALFDRRTNAYRDVKLITLFIAGMLTTGIALKMSESLIAKANEPTWAEQQVNLMISPLNYECSGENCVEEIKKEKRDEVKKINIEELIREVFREESETALAIARCESGLRADAWNENTNGSVDVGIFQINSVHGVRAKWLLNPEVNIMIAKQLYDEQGFSPWVCYKLIK